MVHAQLLLACIVPRHLLTAGPDVPFITLFRGKLRWQLLSSGVRALQAGCLCYLRAMLPLSGLGIKDTPCM